MPACRVFRIVGSSRSDRIVRACVRRRMRMIFDLIFFIMDLIRSTTSSSSSVSRARSFKRNVPRRKKTKDAKKRACDRPTEPGGHGIDVCVRTNGISFVEIDHSSIRFYDVRFKRRRSRVVADAREEGSKGLFVTGVNRNRAS